MNKISNFLWKLFSVVAVFCYSTDEDAYAAKTRLSSLGTNLSGTTVSQRNELSNADSLTDLLNRAASKSKSSGGDEEDEDDSNAPATIGDLYNAFANVLASQSTADAKVYSSTTSLAGSRRVEICPAGYYVSKCGNFAVGYNWLKSAYVNTTQTHNYATSSDPVERFEQMRKFFKGQYLRGWAPDDDGNFDTTKLPPQTKSQNDRDLILGAVCNPNNVKKDSNFGYSCAPCPEAGTVGPSYVHTDYSASTLLIPNSWKFHSIADCYLSQFEDATGSFIYLPLNVNSTSVEDSTPGQFCYYGDSVSANDFKRLFMGSAIGSVRTDTAVSAPAQRYEDSPETSK